ncbi:MAG: NADP-dependent malic enzyme [Chthonomonadales bacterium]
MNLNDEALRYHSSAPPGKLEINPTKPCLTQHDLALAYTPGVAEPCRAIQRNSEDVFRYTGRGNLVAVVTNGTAVLGLGAIGPLAAKPVMEGKALLFKRFSDIDAVDLEIATEDPQAFIAAVKLLEPSFGGINLEDIRAPECFIIEEALQKEMSIPVFHDDQHGTAIISGAALLNALEIVGKRIEDVRIVFSGAGAAATATYRFYIALGARKEHIIVCDSRGVLYKGRTQAMNPIKEELAADTQARTLAEALAGADVFVGLSTAGILTADMVRSMASRPIIFAMANPDPEIAYEEAKAARPDAVVATGRSDYPNQVNNVLGFPFIFRGALDVRARQINEAMKIAAARALAALAKEDVPDAVVKAYGLQAIHFGPDYLIPKPFDSRVLLWVAPAVAQAAMDTGVARAPIDLDRYREALEARLGKSREMMRIVFNKARQSLKRIILTDGAHPKMMRAAQQLSEERIAQPILLGEEHEIARRADELGIELRGLRILSPAASPLRQQFADRLYALLCRQGMTQPEAWELTASPHYFGALMLEGGEGDGMIIGPTYHYLEALKPALQIIGPAGDCCTAAGVYMVTTRNKVLFFADASVNVEMDAEKMADIAILTARLAREFNIEPRIAMLSFSNFGSVSHARVERVRRAVEIVRSRQPELVVDGEMQANTALMEEFLNRTYPFNRLRGEANVLIFPNLESGNIGYNLVQRLANAEAVGPILVGLRHPVHVVQHWDEVKDIVNLAAIAAVSAGNTPPPCKDAPANPAGDGSGAQPKVL